MGEMGEEAGSAPLCMRAIRSHTREGRWREAARRTCYSEDQRCPPGKTGSRSWSNEKSNVQRDGGKGEKARNGCQDGHSLLEHRDTRPMSEWSRN